MNASWKRNKSLCKSQSCPLSPSTTGRSAVHKWPTHWNNKLKQRCVQSVSLDPTAFPHRASGCQGFLTGGGIHNGSGQGSIQLHQQGAGYQTAAWRGHHKRKTLQPDCRTQLSVMHLQLKSEQQVQQTQNMQALLQCHFVFYWPIQKLLMLVPIFFKLLMPVSLVTCISVCTWCLPKRT